MTASHRRNLLLSCIVLCFSVYPIRQANTSNWFHHTKASQKSHCSAKTSRAALLATAVALAFVVSFALPYIPLTARLFSFTPLPLQELAIVVGLALVYLVVLDVVKVQYYKRADKDVSPLLDAQTSAQAKR